MPTFKYNARLRAERARRNMKQPEVAQRAGLYVHTLIDIEGDKVEITKRTFDDIVSAMDKNTDSLQRHAA